MILADDDVGEDGLDGEAYDPYEDPVLMADPVAAGLVSPPGDTVVVAVLVAVVRYGAEDEGGLDTIAWHVPTAIFAAAVFVQWWRDPQRMS